MSEANQFAVSEIKRLCKINKEKDKHIKELEDEIDSYASTVKILEERKDEDISRNVELRKRVKKAEGVIEAAKNHIDLHNKFHEYVNANNDFLPEITTEDIQNGWSGLSEALKDYK